MMYHYIRYLIQYMNRFYFNMIRYCFHHIRSWLHDMRSSCWFHRYFIIYARLIGGI